METYVVATIKSWNIELFHDLSSRLPGNWVLIESPEQLNVDHLEELNPRYIFFPHWSWIVTEKVYSRWECVCFHMTDLPYGRGGSPLQNLIVRGHKSTKISALRMVGELDAGPIYFKSDLQLNGSAQEIFIRATKPISELIERIVNETPCPIEQQGDVTLFERRKAEDGDLSKIEQLHSVYDYIRMLDAEGYPNAFINVGNMTYEFSDAEIRDGEISARVKITPHEFEN